VTRKQQQSAELKVLPGGAKDTALEELDERQDMLDEGHRVLAQVVKRLHQQVDEVNLRLDRMEMMLQGVCHKFKVKVPS